MRNWITLIESAQESDFFWFEPKSNELIQWDEWQELDHATAIAQRLGLNSNANPDIYSDEKSWNSDIIDQALKQGWVRGRYGELAGQKALGGHDTLSLQGERRQVWRAARALQKTKPFSELFVDFNETSDSMNSFGGGQNVRLAGNRLEFFLKRGSVPRETVLESQQQWPATIAGVDLSQLVQEFHHTPEDFYDGNLEQRIDSYGEFQLQVIPTGSLDAEEWLSYDERVDAYSVMTSDAPPIIVDHIGSIIDGTHRLKAAIARGEKTIRAYVGTEASYDPIYDDGEDEWEADEY